jgi:hypothetical protein
MRKYLAILAATVVFLGNYSTVYGLEITVSDNGASSGNDVNIQQETQTQVTQENTSQVADSVDTSATTGENSASENSSENVAIETGDATDEMAVENSGNLTVADAGCCQAETDVDVSENGSNSQNQVNLSQTTSTTTTVDQNIKIQNNIQGYANTGENTANDNTNGDINIHTGNILASSQVINGPVNTAVVSSTTGGGDVGVDVSENGANSQNILNSYLDNLTNSYISSSADIDNFILWDLNTGGNEASYNTGGDILINTGDIDLSVFIENLANLSFTRIDCCELDIYDPGDTNEEETPDIGGNDEGSGNDSGSNGSTLSETAAAEAGGPGLSGLSDTSSGEALNIFFWFGIAFFTLGLKYLTEGITSTKVDIEE